MPLIQNFSIPAGNDVSVEIDITDYNLTGVTLYFKAYAQLHGVPVMSPVVIDKTSLSGGGITILASPVTAFVDFTHADTTTLTPGGYYFEVAGIDALNAETTLTQGLMIITQTGPVP